MILSWELVSKADFHSFTSSAPSVNHLNKHPPLQGSRGLEGGEQAAAHAWGAWGQCGHVGGRTHSAWRGVGGRTGGWRREAQPSGAARLQVSTRCVPITHALRLSLPRARAGLRAQRHHHRGELMPSPQGGRDRGCVEGGQHLKMKVQMTGPRVLCSTRSSLAPRLPIHPGVEAPTPQRLGPTFTFQCSPPGPPAPGTGDVSLSPLPLPRRKPSLSPLPSLRGDSGGGSGLWGPEGNWGDDGS